MIFLEESLRRRDYGSLAAEAEERAGLDCGRVEGGRFGPKNQCQDDGNAGGSSPSRTPERDDSWKESEDSKSWSRDDLKQSSPISGGDKIKSLLITDPKSASASMSRIGVKSLDDLIAIGGGAVREADIAVSGYDDGISVTMTAPVDPENPRGPSAFSSVIIMPPFGNSGSVVDYSNFEPGGNLADSSKQEGGENNSSRLRIASILNQRMVESLEAAERSGISKAVTMAIGSKGSNRHKGYRLWPQFGFDAKLPRETMNKIPDEILLAAAGVQIPPAGSSRAPREAVIKSLRAGVRQITIQQLMQTRDGENWWTENGGSIEMTLDLRDKQSLGYKRYDAKRAKLARSRIRNQGRSWYPLDESEWRVFGCGRDENGQFTPKNLCQEDAESSGGASSQPARDSWKSSAGTVSLTQSQLKQSSPVAGGEKLSSLKIRDASRVAKTMQKLGVTDLNSVVRVGGGVIRGADVTVKSYNDESVDVLISSPVDPKQPEGVHVMTSVMLSKVDGKLTVDYSGLDTDWRITDASQLDAGENDSRRLRIASIMSQQMLESLSEAESLGVAKAEMYAAGEMGDSTYKGYRLWPQFGFDAEIGASRIPADIRLRAAGKKVPSDKREREQLASEIETVTVQQLMKFREGENWWTANGSGIDLTLNFKAKSSLGYKRFKKMKERLPLLRRRNEGRSLIGWLADEVVSRVVSLSSFFGRTTDAIEKRGECTDEDRGPGGTFGPGNDCQKGDGGGGEKQSAGGSRVGAVSWKPGQPAGGVTSRARENPATVRSEDGKEIVSTTIPDAHVYDFAGRQWVATVDAGAKLAAEQDEIRGGRIDTGKKIISGPESEYILASITEQARSAMDRGIEPKFYSPEEREDQLAAFSEMIPQVRGGRTKTGVMVEQEDAEHLFRVIQAITSPNASPFINMQRTDSLLQKFFDGDGMVTTSDSLGVTGKGIRKSLRRFQKIVDTLGKRTDGSIDTAAGLRAARELLQGRSMRAGDIEKFFADFASKSDAKGVWKPGSYLVSEVVPVFSTFGPKVGPFYANNNGDLDHLTADVWFSRTWGRVTGELVIPGSPTKSAKQAAKLAKVIGKASDDQLHGVSAADLSEAVKQTSETGAVSDVLRAWAGARLRHYARGDYKEKTGLGGQLNRLAKNIVENDTSLIGDPGSGSRRSHMIRLMREASRQTGVPVAYLQDILWQDEQDAYGALGAKTATNVGEPSLYSDQIRRLAANNGENRKPRARADRGYRRDYDQPEPFVDDYERGGREQMLWEAALAHLSDEEFANAVIKLAEKARPTEEFREERRNFAALDAAVEIRAADCGRDEGGKFGDGNTCAGDGSKGEALSNSKGESFRGVRRKSDKTQTKVARKLYQMRVPEKNLKALVRDLGGKVSNTFVEINSDYGDEGVNVFVRDRDNNETHYIHIGYYGATVYTTERLSSPDVSRIQAATKAAMPKTIDDRLWLGGSEYPVYVINDPKQAEEDWGGLSAKQRLKKERRSALAETRGDAPAPKKDRITGSDKNAEGSASNKSGDIELKESTIAALESKAKQHNAAMKKKGKPNWTRVRVSSLKAVYRRGAGAFSVSHRPGMTRDQWAMARVNAFITLAGRGRPENAKYVGDNDLLHSEHPKYSQQRSADCGRDESGRFGPKNQCQEDAGQGDSKPSPLPAQWSPASGGEPFDGASRYSTVSASGGERIAKSLDRMGIDPGDAIAATGAPERADVTVRTAPEFSSNEAFAGGESPPIFIDFTADVAGIRRGMAGSSVLGTRKNTTTGEQEKVLYHNVFEVLPSVQADAGKRHAAARAAYRSMVASIENARKSGIAEIRFSAAGRADDSAKDMTAFRGYTIWPRMGFDAKLPDRIRAKLPESLSHATSLLDLHATREGTQWWAENGEDIDVSLRLTDRSSPQNKIVDRFIKHFAKDRREMPLGAGDDWLSPEDLLRLDEMWQEVWDEGDLDDYEYNDGNS